MSEQRIVPSSTGSFIDALAEAVELDTLIEQSPLKNELRPAICKACARVDEAADALEKTPEYAAFADRIRALGKLLREAQRKLEQ